MTPERARELAAAWRERIREDDGGNLVWDLVDAQERDPQGRPAEVGAHPDEWLTEVERSGDLSRVAWAAHRMMTPAERARLDDEARRLLGREIAEVARNFISNEAPATDAHQSALKAEQNKPNMTISQMHRLWVERRAPVQSTLKDWTKAKDRFVEIFGDIKVAEITRSHAWEFQALLRKLPKNISGEAACATEE